MKKILVVHNFYRNFGGEDSNIHEEIKFLKQKYEVEFFYTKNSNKLKIVDFLTLFLRNNFFLTKKFKSKIDSFNPDFVYIHNTWFTINLGIFRVLKKKNINTIVKIHNFRYECSRYFLSKNHLKSNESCNACGFKKKKLLIYNKYFEESYLKSLALFFYSLRYYRILKNNKLTVIAITNFHKTKLIKNGIKKNNIHVINNPINFFSGENKEKKNRIVYAGRISKEKGIDELIKAFINSELVNYQLLIIGDGNIKDEVKKKYSQVSSVIFQDFLPNKDVLEIISTSKAVITATKLFEGQPRLLCEASSMRTISIFPSFGGMEDFFPEDYIYKFEQFNYLDLVKKINLLANDEKRINLEEKIFNYTKNMLSSQVIHKKFEDLISEYE
tara:strand:- start:1060 stop:2214 length:1155 start_codon:yes stop_codon:yes gene_type:complete